MEVTDMNKKVIIAIIVFALVFLLANSMYTVAENEYACTVRFSKIISVTDQAGLQIGRAHV